MAKERYKELLQDASISEDEGEAAAHGPPPPGMGRWPAAPPSPPNSAAAGDYYDPGSEPGPARPGRRRRTVRGAAPAANVPPRPHLSQLEFLREAATRQQQAPSAADSCHDRKASGESEATDWGRSALHARTESRTLAPRAAAATAVAAAIDPQEPWPEAPPPLVAPRSVLEGVIAALRRDPAWRAKKRKAREQRKSL